jgi:hypothetical protein
MPEKQRNQTLPGMDTLTEQVIHRILFLKANETGSCVIL